MSGQFPQPLVYNHIPKTAGTSLREAIATALGRKSVTHVLDHAMFGTFQDFASLDSRLRGQIIDRPEDLPHHPVFVTGHIAPSTTRARYPHASTMTALREPRARLVSQWLFNRAHTDFMVRHWGTFDAWFLAGRGTLSEWLANAETVAISDNAIARLLVWPHPAVPPDGFIPVTADREVLAAAQASLASFDHVAVVEDPQMLERLREWTGLPLELGHHNESRPIPPALRPDLWAEIHAATEAIDQATRLDRELWRTAIAPLVPNADLDAVADSAFDQSVKRALTALAASGHRATVRASLEATYMLARRLQLNPRRRRRR